MTDFKIDVSELKTSQVNDLLESVRQFLGVEPERAGSLLIASVAEEVQVSRPRFKGLLKRFIHSKGLRPNFRVISIGPDQFKIKKRKTHRE